MKKKNSIIQKKQKALCHSINMVTMIILDDFFPYFFMLFLFALILAKRPRNDMLFSF